MSDVVQNDRAVRRQTYVLWRPWLLILMLLMVVVVKSHTGPAGGLGRYALASWYGPKFHGKTMANGKRFDMHALTVAHKRLALGTRLILTNPDNGEQVKVKVTDRGPYVAGRQLDVSYRVARKLGFVKKGLSRLHVKIFRQPHREG
jgi:rare lipoprotein A (peptidoglycan hydrolase)